MKRHSFIVLLGLALGVTVFGLLYANRIASYRHLEQTCGPELAWVKKEFKLSDGQFERVRALHLAYKPVCTEYCRRIQEKNRDLARLMDASSRVTPAIKVALSEATELRKECLAQMLEHFYAVSRVMPPEQGKRYLARMQAETAESMAPVYPSVSGMPESARSVERGD